MWTSLRALSCLAPRRLLGPPLSLPSWSARGGGSQGRKVKAGRHTADILSRRAGPEGACRRRGPKAASSIPLASRAAGVSSQRSLGGARAVQIAPGHERSQPRARGSGRVEEAPVPTRAAFSAGLGTHPCMRMSDSNSFASRWVRRGRFGASAGVGRPTASCRGAPLRVAGMGCGAEHHADSRGNRGAAAFVWDHLRKADARITNLSGQERVAMAKRRAGFAAHPATNKPKVARPARRFVSRQWHAKAALYIPVDTNARSFTLKNVVLHCHFRLVW